jgi:hypothetical protein
MIRLLALVVLAIASFATSIIVEQPPGPPEFTGTKLVNDADHPFIPQGPNDMRGPCPALNTLASHGVCQDYFSCRSYG